MSLKTCTCLDAYSTKSYHPLPIPILNNFEDGNRILNKMITLGKFEKINSNWSKGLKGIALTDPYRTEIKVYVPKKTSPKSDDRTKINISISEETPPKTYATRFLNYIKKLIQ